MSSGSVPSNATASASPQSVISSSTGSTSAIDVAADGDLESEDYLEGIKSPKAASRKNIIKSIIPSSNKKDSIGDLEMCIAKLRKKKRKVWLNSERASMCH
jgi:hypothetical protein